ncbi:hypothetical protein [Atopobium fossor]|uniref:hypothetical protein n=1 Tax=Atopobium fossor TaxID=39487 RepID=UPI0004178695|nr:hypothetical protein [Atopobium fossor]
MALKTKREVFAPIDGVLALCEPTAARCARGVNWTSAAGLRTLCLLPYRKSQVRSVDIDALGSDAPSLSLKVCVRRPPDLSVANTAVIAGKAYDITKTDEDGRLAWLYLTRFESVGTCELVATSAEYDDLGIAHATEKRTSVYVRSVEWSGNSTDAGQLASLHISIRADDWAGERAVVMRGKRHSVTRVTGDGEWTTLECAEGIGDVGQ